MGEGVDSILEACDAEVRRRDALPCIETGQIADSYDTLHGVRFIELILRSLPPSLSDDERLNYSLYLFDAFILHNLKDLSRRAADTLDHGRVTETIDAMSWIQRLLRLSLEAGELATIPKVLSNARNNLMDNAFCEGFERLCRSLQTYFSAQGASSNDDNATPHALLFHQSKNLIMLVQETLRCDRSGRPEGVDPLLSEAHFRCVAAACSGLRLSADTYINQFCLLHQLPELLTPLVLRDFETVERHMDDAASAARSARRAGDLLGLITACLWPLIDLLRPEAYYAFRANLGATSGSSSAAIRGKLLTSAYVRLAEAYTRQDAGAADEAGVELRHQIARIRRSIYRWRGLHMALPRNVLGANGTRSLMGSPDALKAVETMADGFSKRDPLTSRFGPVSIGDFAVGDAAASLDRWLLAATGDVAQQRFRQVQERTGPWRKTQKPF